MSLRILLTPPNDLLRNPIPNRLYHVSKCLSKNHEIILFSYPKHPLAGDILRTLPSREIRYNTIGIKNLGLYYIVNALQHYVILKIVISEVDIVVHANILPSLFAAKLAKNSGKPSIYDFMDYFPESASVYYNFNFLKYITNNIVLNTNIKALRYSEKVITPSYGLKKVLETYIKQRNIYVISNGLDAQIFRPIDKEHARKTIELDYDGYLILLHGSLDVWIDITAILHAIKILRSQGKEVGLLLVGFSHNKPFFRKIIEEANRMNIRKLLYIYPIQPYEKMLYFINSSDLVISPVKKMNLATPLKVLEALACGRPVVAWEIAEYKIWFKKGIFYYRSLDELPSRIMEAINYMINYQELITYSELIRKTFDWKRIASMYENLILEFCWWNKIGSILIVLGTRPEVIKTAPIILELERRNVPYYLVWSGQHKEYKMSKIFFEEFKLPEPNINLNTPVAKDLIDKLAFMVKRLKNIIRKEKPFVTYALGDTTTTLAASLASTYEGIPFIHDEAGMRSHDFTMPEELNRRVADSLASLHFAPTKLAYYNLLFEGASREYTFLTWSTAVDALTMTIPKLINKSLEIEIDNNTLVITVHRRENILNKEILNNIINFIIQLSDSYNIFFPVHPHTLLKLKETNLIEIIRKGNNIILSEPIGYLQFLATIYKSKAIITDSGGVQEEAFILGKQTITLRKTTEWPETVIMGYNILLDPQSLKDMENIVDLVISHIEKNLGQIDLSTSPIGDGKSRIRVTNILENILNENIKIKNIKLNRLLPEKPYYIYHLSELGQICFDPDSLLPCDTGKSGKLCIDKVPQNVLLENLYDFIKIKWNEIDLINKDINR